LKIELEILLFNRRRILKVTEFTKLLEVKTNHIDSLLVYCTKVVKNHWFPH